VKKKISELFEQKNKDILNIYFTAGYPSRDDTVDIILALQESGADIIEIGAPYSDPLADGETIQMSSQTALRNGISLDLIFKQLEAAIDRINIPLVLMGYFNQFFQYGFENLLDRMRDCAIEALIIPDLPEDYYERHYKHLFEEKGIKICFLISPETSDERIRRLDTLSSGFLYVVAQSSTTGGTVKADTTQRDYFKKLNNMDLRSPRLIGFGIHDRQSFTDACKYANGAIIGSAFIRTLQSTGLNGIDAFIKAIVKD